MPAVILNHRGTPEPSSEVQRRLAGVHPRLSLKFIDGVDHHWAICMRWDETDTRWAHVQSQDIDPNRSMDIIGYLPMDCPLDQAPAYMGKVLRQFPRADVQRIADRMAEFNLSAPLKTAVEEAIAEVLDRPDPSATTAPLAPKKRGRPRKSPV